MTELDHDDILARPWLYPPRIAHLIASLHIAQLAIDDLRADLATADEEIGLLQERLLMIEDVEEKFEWRDE